MVRCIASQCNIRKVFYKMAKMEKILKVGLVQQSVGSDVAANKKKLVKNITDCANRGAQLVVLQELHNTPYFCQVEDVDKIGRAHV